jgi:hypothetical protein
VYWVCVRGVLGIYQGRTQGAFGVYEGIMRDVMGLYLQAGHGTLRRLPQLIWLLGAPRLCLGPSHVL